MFIDHLGIEYETLTDMLRAYRVSRDIYKYRIEHGYSLEEILTKKKKPKVGKVIKDKYRNVFPNVTQFCKYYGIQTSQYYYKLKKGYSIDDIVEENIRNIK